MPLDIFESFSGKEGERRFFPIPRSVVASDSFLLSCSRNSEIGKNPHISSWLVDQCIALRNLGIGLDKELQITFFRDDSGDLFTSEQTTVESKKKVATGRHVPGLDIPWNFQRVGMLHNHLIGEGGSAAFSNGGRSESHGGDWDYVLLQQGSNFNVVITPDGFIYIVYQPEGKLLQMAKDYLARTEPRLLKPGLVLPDPIEDERDILTLARRVLREENSPIRRRDMWTDEKTSDARRIEINQQLCKMFGFSFYKIDSRSKRIIKLV